MLSVGLIVCVSTCTSISNSLSVVAAAAAAQPVDRDTHWQAYDNDSAGLADGHCAASRNQAQVAGRRGGD